MDLDFFRMRKTIANGSDRGRLIPYCGLWTRRVVFAAEARIRAMAPDDKTRILLTLVAPSLCVPFLSQVRKGNVQDPNTPIRVRG